MSGSAYGELARHGAQTAAALSTTGWGRLVLVVIGGYVGTMGASAWWHGSQHAPIAVAIGAALLVLAAFGWWRARDRAGKERRSKRTARGLVGVVLTLLAGSVLLLRRRRHASLDQPPEELPSTLETLEPSSAAAQEAGRLGIRGLVRALPGIVWATLRGTVGGGLAFAAIGVGLALVTIASARWLLELPRWLVWTNVIVAPLVLGLAGAYVGTVRGFLAALARALVDSGMIPALYALVRPAIARVASGITRHADPLTRTEAVRRIHAHIEAVSTRSDAPAPKGFLERFERRLAERTQLWLALASIASAADAADRASALAELEQRGVDGVASSLADAIASAYRMQAVVAFAIALGLLSVPWITFVIAG